MIKSYNKAMKKDLGVKPYLFPMPVLMIATYGDNDVVDVMNMAWGGICSDNMIALNISEGHKTSENIRKRGAFSVSVADVSHMLEADYFGMVSGNNVADKFEKSGLHATKSTKVDAPIVQEFLLTLECKLIEAGNVQSGFRVLGEIVNTIADESIIDDEGNVDLSKIHAFAFDQAAKNYYAIGEKLETAGFSLSKFK